MDNCGPGQARGPTLPVFRAPPALQAHLKGPDEDAEGPRAVRLHRAPGIAEHAPASALRTQAARTVACRFDWDDRSLVHSESRGPRRTRQRARPGSRVTRGHAKKGPEPRR